MIRKGDTITIKPEWRDQDDARFTWVAAADQTGDRIMITPLGTGLAFPPVQTVRTDMLEGF